MVSASSTRSLRSNSRAMHALWTFILKSPTPSAPKAITPSRCAVVVHLDALDAERRYGVEVARDLETLRPAQAARGTSMHARRARR